MKLKLFHSKRVPQSEGTNSIFKYVLDTMKSQLFRKIEKDCYKQISSGEIRAKDNLFQKNKCYVSRFLKINGQVCFEVSYKLQVKNINDKKYQLKRVKNESS